jgi:hypothetical protein
MQLADDSTNSLPAPFRKAQEQGTFQLRRNAKTALGLLLGPIPRNRTSVGLAGARVHRLPATLFLGCLPASAYKYLGNHVLQSDDSASDTQAAINVAVDGMIIKIPNGSYSWGQQVTNGKHTAIHIIAALPGASSKAADATPAPARAQVGKSAAH